MPRNQIEGVVATSNISPRQSLLFTAEGQVERLRTSCLKCFWGKSLVLKLSLYLQSDPVTWAEISTRWHDGKIILDKAPESKMLVITFEVEVKTKKVK